MRAISAFSVLSVLSLPASVAIMLGVHVPTVMADPSDDAYTEFTQRVPLHYCGTVRMAPPPHAIPPHWVDCMRNARNAGTGAELVTKIANFFLEDTTTYYRVYNNDQDVEIFVDDNDRAHPGWRHYACPIPDTDLNFEPPEC